MPQYMSEVQGRGGIYAKVVAASVYDTIPIYTLETRAPKFIDAEMRTHRMLSQNSSSSRAVPFKKPGEESVYLPFDIRLNQKGMQGYEEMSDKFQKWSRFHLNKLLGHVFHDLDRTNTTYGPIHKQHINRYMEPWMFQSKVITGTEWGNFFKQRLAPDAQPEIQELARCMKEAMEQSAPIELTKHQWHLPYVDDYWKFQDHEGARIVSAARCARTSYNNQDKVPSNLGEDIKLSVMLQESEHMTPFEHQAKPMGYLFDSVHTFPSYTQEGITHKDRFNRFWSANFRGWIQNRQLMQDWNGV